jgi:L-amino acid N-acyltransferase YncA
MITTLEAMSSRGNSRRKIAKQFPVIIAELDGVVVGFGMYSEFRFREAYKFTVEHSVYVNNDFHGKELGKYYFKINSTGKKTRITHYDGRD